MSKYTNVMLYIPASENEKKRIEEVNQFVFSGRKIALWDLNDSERFPDIFPRFVYAGVFNYFDLEKFLEHITTNVKWEAPEYVQLIVLQENMRNCKIYSHAGAVLVMDSTRY